MPKVVDHAARRATLAAALWRVVERDGVPAVTARAVAAEAGWSVGALQHYFPSRGTLIVFAMETVEEGVRRRLEALDPTAPPRPAVQAFLEQLVPLDPQRRLEAEVWFALTSHAQSDPAVVAHRQEVDEALWDAARSVVEELARVGQLAPHRDPDTEAVRMHALLDGLALQAITRPDRVTPEKIRRVLDVHLDDLARG